MCNRAILASKHNDVDRINDIASRYSPGEAKIYLSADKSLAISNKLIFYPSEFLNQIEDASLPPHKLSLKLRRLIILLRNISQNEGLCETR